MTAIPAHARGGDHLDARSLAREAEAGLSRIILLVLDNAG
jgi:hypothetical protein